MIDTAYWESLSGYNSSLTTIIDGNYVDASTTNASALDLYANLNIIRDEISKILESYDSGNSKYNGIFQDLTVNGVLNIKGTINQDDVEITNLKVEDKTITMNKADLHVANDGNDSGIIVETSDTYMPSMKWYTDGTIKRWGIKTPASNNIHSLLYTEELSALPSTGNYTGRTVILTTGERFMHNGSAWVGF